MVRRRHRGCVSVEGDRRRLVIHDGHSLRATRPVARAIGRRPGDRGCAGGICWISHGLPVASASRNSWAAAVIRCGCGSRNHERRTGARQGIGSDVGRASDLWRLGIVYGDRLCARRAVT